MRTAGAVVLVSCLGLVACKEPESTFKRMQRAACAGDANGFFEHVDKDSVRDGMADVVRRKMKKAPKAKNGAEELGQEIAKKLVEDAVDEVFEQAMDDWKTDLKKGENGNICKWEMLDSSDKTVRIKRPSGDKSTLTFEKKGDAWKLVEYESD